MGEAAGPRLQDGVSLVPGRDSACALEAVAHRDDPRRAGAVGRGAQCGGLCESIERRPEEDLERQLARLVEHAASKGLSIVKSVSEIGSGRNGQRPKLIGLLRDRTIGAIVVEHRDRLGRFGSEYIEAALQSTGRKVVVVDEKERKDDLVQDMIEVLTSFRRRRYGRGSAKDKAKMAMEAIAHE